MKRGSLFIIFACFAMALVAQDAIRVNYKGAHPTISDFVSAYLSSHDAEEEEGCVDESFNAVSYAWNQRQKGIRLDDGNTITVDEKNGYVIYEYRSEYESVESVLRIEMCYWNEADRRHKLFAYNVSSYQNGRYCVGQFDGITFFRYDNVTKKMTYCEAPGFEEVYTGADGASISYSLPRVGKDIIVTLWYENEKKERTLKWNGHGFSY